MGNLISSLITEENNELSGNQNISAATATGPTVIIGDTTTDCTVQGSVRNEGKVNFQTDGKTSFKVGNKNERVKAKAIINKTEVYQTVANTTITHTQSSTQPQAERLQSSNSIQNGRTESQLNLRPIGSLTWNPQLTEGQIITYNNIGSFTKVTGEVKGTLTNKTTYHGDGIEKAFSSDHTDGNEIIVNNLGPVNDIKKCNKLVNQLNVSIVPK